MSSLYKINEQINSIFSRYEYSTKDELIDTETGELIPASEVEKMLADIAISKQEKLDNYAFKIKDDNLIIEGIKAEISKLTEYKISVERRKLALLEALKKEYQGKSYKDKLGRYSVGFRKSKAVEITSESSIPEKYLVPQKPKVSKVDIKKDIEAGIEVPGAVLKDNLSCTIK